jgi:hypothetical protein
MLPTPYPFIISSHSTVGIYSYLEIFSLTFPFSLRHFAHDFLALKLLHKHLVFSDKSSL